MKGRVSRIGSYAIASSLKDHPHQPCITCTTFNILAPIYKRLSHKVFLYIYICYCIGLLFFIFCFVLQILNGFRTRIAVKAIIGHIGWPGTNEYWILYYRRDLPLFVCRNSGLEMKSL